MNINERKNLTELIAQYKNARISHVTNLPNTTHVKFGVPVTHIIYDETCTCISYLANKYDYIDVCIGEETSFTQEENAQQIIYTIENQAKITIDKNAPTGIRIIDKSQA